MSIEVAAVSDTGLVREANEDSFLVDNELFVFAVADGMGGHVAGEIASATAIETIRAAVAGGIDIETAISDANKAVLKKAASKEELNGMGTTITALGYSKDKKLVIAHVGDSRAYVLHRQLIDETNTAENTELVRITKDHSLVEELVDAGEITEEEANVHPRRSVITRALGISNEVEVDTIDIPFLKGDRYLLCSDGLTSMVRDEDIVEVLKSHSSPNECAKTLVSKANQAGGNDNITVIVLDVLDTNLKEPKVAIVASSIPADESSKTLKDTKGRFTFGLRIFFSFLVVAALIFGAFLTAERFANQGYFFDSKNGQVVLMSGQQGGVLWWEPKLNSQTGIEVENLKPADKLRVTRNERYSSREEALKQLEEMRKRQLTEEEKLAEKLSKNSSRTTTPDQSTSSTAPITISNGTSVSSEQ